MGRDKSIPFHITKVDPYGNSCATKTELCPTRGGRKLWAIHNFLMWLCWVALMGFIVFTSRYGKKYWRNSVFIHAVFGIVIFVLSLGAGAMAWGRIHGMDFNKWTALLENIAIYLSWGLCISGMVGYFFRRFGKYEWNT